MERPYEKLIRYCKVNTMSDDTVPTSPTTQCQFDLARLLEQELIAIGVQDVYLDDACVVYGKLPATEGLEHLPAIGFLAHVDTVPDFSGVDVQPLVIENYDGKDIPLPKGGRAIRVSDFPHLPAMKGKTLVTASGDTLLGADDKAGIAEIISLCERLIASGEPHGTVCIAFTPDEEVGLGVSRFDTERFGAEFAYTLDGSAVGEVICETFNAASAKVTVHGKNVHPGSAKDVMLNASLVAMEFNAMLPAGDTPARTEGYEGFFHLMQMSGGVETASLAYIVRDHDLQKLGYRVETMRHIEKCLNEKYGAGTVEVEIKDGYRNMAEKIRKRMEIVDAAMKATEEAGVTPIVVPIRGGTDGAVLTEMGVPCPNLGTGCYGFHGPYEHAVAEDMDRTVEILAQILKQFLPNNG